MQHIDSLGRGAAKITWASVGETVPDRLLELAAQPAIPRSSGTLPTGGALFVWFLLGVIVVAGGLTYLPALALGPIVEHLRLVIGALS